MREGTVDRKPGLPQDVQLEMKYADNVLLAVLSSIPSSPRTPREWRIVRMIESYRKARDKRGAWQT